MAEHPMCFICDDTIDTKEEGCFVCQTCFNVGLHGACAIIYYGPEVVGAFSNLRHLFKCDECAEQYACSPERTARVDDMVKCPVPWFQLR